jgi:hypothetical protein
MQRRRDRHPVRRRWVLALAVVASAVAASCQPRPPATTTTTVRPSTTTTVRPSTTTTVRPSTTTSSTTTTTTSTTTTSTTTSTTVPPSPVDPSGRFVIAAGPLQTLWVDPVHGSDANSGASAAQALRSPAEAWRRIPASQVLTTGYRILLQPGTYPSDLLPSYMEHRWGTATAPVVIEAASGRGSAVLTGDLNVFDVRHLYLLGLTIDRSGDAFHCERCSYVLVRDSRLDGRGGAHETVKVNQSDHVYLEDSEISGAWDNAIDFVAVAEGHMVANEIHDAEDWCAYAKGGSSGIRVIGNEIHHCGTGGFTSGQGTGFEFMVAPWLHYETYGITAANNVIHDTEGAGLGVNGGYNVVYAYNTLYRVGSRSHTVEFVHGGRGCDGDTATCAAHRALGGWGSTASEGQYIPSRHVVFANNVVYNPAGFASRWQHFQVAGPLTPPSGTGVPSPSRADDDLRITGNVIFNGASDMPLGFDDGCAASNPTCNEALVRTQNLINAVEPTLVDPANGRWEPAPASPLRTTTAVAVPMWGWADAPAGVPAVTPTALGVDRAGTARSGWGHPGAYEP